MTKIRLFIQNTEIELNEDVSFALTRQFEELVNPTTIYNDFSKTVKIPFTDANNKTFGMLFKTDRQILDSSSSFIGQFFDPTIKNDFMLLYNNELVISGYCKISFSLIIPTVLFSSIVAISILEDLLSTSISLSK